MSATSALPQLLSLVAAAGKRTSVSLFLCYFVVAHAEDCKTSCGDQCRVKAWPLPDFIEPTCNLKCEAFKTVSCIIDAPLPTLPLTPREQVERGATLVCTIPNQIFLQTISTKCNFQSAAQSAADAPIIEAAKQLLIDNRLIEASAFVNVSIAFCDFVHGDGVAPDRDTVFLHPAHRKSGRYPQQLIPLASLLAHEMMHVHQYRLWGTDKFKCDYARQMAECGLCQDRRNSIERTAFEEADRVRRALEARYPRTTGRYR